MVYNTAGRSNGFNMMKDVKNDKSGDVLKG